MGFETFLLVCESHLNYKMYLTYVSKPIYWDEIRDEEIDRVANVIVNHYLKRESVYNEIEVRPMEATQRHGIMLSLKTSEHGSFRGLYELGYDYRKNQELMDNIKSKVLEEIEHILDKKEKEAIEKTDEPLYKKRPSIH
jgi:hypothetical protein